MDVSRPAAEDWHVFQCPECGSPAKVREGQAGCRLRCPACGEEITAPGGRPASAGSSGGSSAERTISAPAERASAGGARSPRETTGAGAEPGPALMSEANARGAVPSRSAPQLAVDRLERAEFRSTEDPEMAIPSEGLRVGKRKRRRQQDFRSIPVPQWDMDEDDVPEAMVVSDEEGWENVTTATVGTETLADGRLAERRKRIRKRRLPKGVEKTFRWAGRAAALSAIALGVLILVGAIAGGIHLVRSRQEIPAAPQAPLEAVDRAFATTSEAEAAMEVVRSFLRAPTLEEKLAHVRFPGEVRPLMEQWYATHPPEPADAVRPLELQSLVKLVNVKGMKFITLAAQLLPTHEIRFFAVEQTPQGGKLDWEVSVGYQPMALEEFKRQTPQEPVPFRALVQRADYYNGRFSDPSRWYCCRLTYPGDRSFSIYAYLDLNDPLQSELSERLENTSYSMIVALAYPPEAESADQVRLVRVLEEHWFLPGGPVTLEMARR